MLNFHSIRNELIELLQENSIFQYQFSIYYKYSRKFMVKLLRFQFIEFLFLMAKDLLKRLIFLHCRLQLVQFQNRYQLFLQ